MRHSHLSLLKMQIPGLCPRIIGQHAEFENPLGLSDSEYQQGEKESRGKEEPAQHKTMRRVTVCHKPWPISFWYFIHISS